MLSNLYLLRYNNYYNRQLKVLNKLSDYEPYVIGTLTNINFIPNDGIHAKQVVNWKQDIPDYVLVAEGNEIISRWFVIESRRTLAGQFELELFRDTLADYYSEIQNAPIFVEKAMLDANNPLIFNQEDMTFNQIRQQPRLLNDITKTPWIVGYIPKDSFQEDTEVSTSINLSTSEIDLEVENIGDWDFYQYTTSPAVINYTAYTGLHYRLAGSTRGGVTYSHENLWVSTNSTITSSRFHDSNLTYNKNEFPKKDIQNQFINGVRSNSTYKSYFDGFISSRYTLLNDTQTEELINLNEKLIIDTTSGNIYKINLIFSSVDESISLNSEPTMVSSLLSMLPTPNSGSTNNAFSTRLQGYEVLIDLNQVQVTVKTTVNEDRFHLEDQPYDMFCMPYNAVKLYIPDIQAGRVTKQIGTALATAIGETTGSSNVYDVQLLPYCPVQYAWDDEYNWIDLSKTKYSLITDAKGGILSALIWCRTSSFNFNMDLYIPDKSYAIEKKIASQTEVYRLVSPNYGSAFEFNPYKNGGVSYLRVDCSYKPFNPYIRIAPMFNELYGYGGQYDSRGLILSGDFSITQLSNAWANYELQNKNYQAIFDRQIQNMEVQNKYQRINDLVGITTGTISSGVSGAMTGAAAGPYGAIAGAAIGTVAGAATGAYDYSLREMLRNEAMDYTKDQFGYQLGNIQALPTALAKTSTLTINNSLVPMLEKYDCTSEEKEAFRNKIEYNGMTVMTVGTMSDYSEGYFKGKLIRLESIDDDFHVVNTIASELYKGVYLT